MPGPSVIPAGGLRGQPVVGGAGAAGAVPVITAAQFADTVKSGKVVVEFFSYGCGFCRRARPAVHAAAAALGADTKVVMLSVDDPAGKAIAMRHGLSYYPTFAVFAGGTHVGTFCRDGNNVPSADFIAGNVRGILARAPGMNSTPD